MTAGAVNENLEVPRQTFAELAELKDLSEIGKLTKEQLRDMCQTFPLAATELIIDLMKHLPKKKEYA